MRRLLLAAGLLAWAGPASAQVFPANVRLCDGRLSLTGVETRSPASPQGNYQYWATFLNNSGRALNAQIVFTGSATTRITGSQSMPAGARSLQVAANPAGIAPPLRNEALVNAIRVSCSP